jgi:hypothetical protein
MDNYDEQERIAIKQDSHISEREAIIQTKREMSEPECVLKAKALAARQHQDKIDKRMKMHKPCVPYIERGEK